MKKLAGHRIVKDHMSNKPQAFEPLTVREHEVAALLTEGLSNKLIAAQLVMSYHTAKFHVTNVIIKLGASTRVDAAVKYARWLDAQPRTKRPHKKAVLA